MRFSGGLGNVSFLDVGEGYVGGFLLWKSIEMCA